MSGITRRKSSRSRSQGSEPSVSRGRSRSTSASTRQRNARSTEKSPDKKRKRSPSFTSDAPATFKRVVDGRIVDAYCWVCHKLGQDSVCSSCPRVYHQDCLKKIKKNLPNDLTCECRLKTVDGKNGNFNFNAHELKKLLQYVMQEAIKEEKKSNQKFRHAENSRFCRLFQAWPSENDNLCKIMDLNILLDNMNGEEPYSSTGQFFLDVKWIYHNCCILYGPDYNITEAALKLEKNFKKELIDMEACPQCYYTKYSDNYLHADFFAKVCRKPHAIIWAKLRGSPFWPAKCLKIHNGHADVRFFGTHDKSNIALDKCYKMSLDNPLKKVIHQPKYKEAMRELSIYINTYESTIGPFKYYPLKTPLEDNKARVKKSIKKVDIRLNNAEKVDSNEQNSDHMEMKVRASFPLLENFPDNESNENVPDTVEGVDIDSNVVCHMTFTADKHNGPANELNNSEDILDSSVPQCSLPEASLNSKLSLSSLEETPGLLSTAVLPASSEIEIPTEAQNSLNYLNVATLPVISSVSANEMPLYELPVITSAVSNSETSNDISTAPSTSHSFPVITSTVSANERENLASNIFAQEEENVNNTRSDKPSVPIMHKRVINNFINDELNFMFEDGFGSGGNSGGGGDDDDDEIQVLSEENHNSIVDDYMSNPSIIKAFTEILLDSRPELKRYFLAFHQCFMQFFVVLSIQFVFSKFAKLDVQNFLQYLKKALKKCDSLKKVLSKLQKEKSAVDKARLEAIESKLAAEKSLAEAVKVREKLEDEIRELKKKVESMGQGQFHNQKSELKDMIIQKASAKVQNKGKTHDLDLLNMQLVNAKQKIIIKEESIYKLTEENGKLKSILTDAGIKTNTCDFGVQTEESSFDFLEREIQQSDPAFILNQNQDSSHILENLNETSDICQEQEDLTQAEVQVEMQRDMFIIETMSSVSSSSTLNTGVLQQVYEENMLTSECTTMMSGPSTEVINATAPTLVPVPVVVTPNQVIPPAGPIFLDAASSAAYLDSINPRKSKAKFSGLLTAAKRKKKNV